MSYLIQVRGLKLETAIKGFNECLSYLIQVRGLKRELAAVQARQFKSYLIQVRGLKHRDAAVFKLQQDVVPYIGTWIETRWL